MISKIIFEKIQSQILKSNKILLVGHKKADGDALGALCSMLVYLRSINKEAKIYCIDLVYKKYQFLPYIEEVKNDISKVIAFKPDLIIVLDTGDLKHAGLVNDFEKFSSGAKIINIDHHPSNDNYGDINLVQTNAVATCEIIYHFFKAVNFKITKDVATCLLTGILFDTNNFSNPNTSVTSLETTSELLKMGARFPQINDNTLKNKNLNALQLMGEVLSRLQLNEKYSIATTVITKKDFKKYQVDPEVFEGIANFLNNLSGVDVAMILKEEEDGKVRGSLRTNTDFIDLSKLAKILGGGGHKKAAGFSVNGKLKQTKTGWQIV